MKYCFFILAAFILFSCAKYNIEDQKTDNLESLIKAEKHVFVEGKTFEDAIDFLQFVRPVLISEGVNQVNIKSSITFKRCKFKKKVSGFDRLENGTMTLVNFWNNLSFIACEFEDEVNFRGVSINGRVDFSQSVFRGAVNFEDAHFNHRVFFNNAKFEEALRFQNSYFARKANFMNTEYFGKTSFQNSFFNNELHLGASIFHEYLDASLLDVRGNMFLNFAQFDDRVDFSNSVFNGDANIVDVTCQSVDFSRSRFMGKFINNAPETSKAFKYEECFFLFQNDRSMLLGDSKM